MPQVFKVKNSSVENKVPDAGDLATAELALNLKDQKLYSKDADGNVFEIGTGGGGACDCEWDEIKNNPITIDEKEPENPNLGDLWVDLGECPPELKIWNDCNEPGDPTWTPIGGATDNPGVFTKEVTLVADNKEYAPCTLTATEAEADFATRVEHEWYRDGVDITPIAKTATHTLSATIPGTYKYQEKWMGDDGVAIYSSAEIVIQKLEIKKPEVLTPKNGAGIGGDTTYNPETSAIAAVDEVDGATRVPGVLPYAWYAAHFSSDSTDATGKFVTLAGDSVNDACLYSTDGFILE